jgi:hypothetical protein
VKGSKAKAKSLVKIKSNLFNLIALGKSSKALKQSPPPPNQIQILEQELSRLKDFIKERISSKKQKNIS